MKCKYVKVTYQVNDKVTKCFLHVNICDNGEVWERKTYIGKAVCSDEKQFPPCKAIFCHHAQNHPESSQGRER